MSRAQTRAPEEQSPAGSRVISLGQEATRGEIWFQTLAYLLDGRRNPHCPNPKRKQPPRCNCLGPGRLRKFVSVGVRVSFRAVKYVARGRWSQAASTSFRSRRGEPLLGCSAQTGVCHWLHASSSNQQTTNKRVRHEKRNHRHNGFAMGFKQTIATVKSQQTCNMKEIIIETRFCM